MSDALHHAPPARPAFCFGMTGWKRAALRALYAGAAEPPHFFDKAEVAAAAAHVGGGDFLFWASRERARMEAIAQAQGVPAVRVEDGFIRSVGLGAAAVGALSLVLDRSGIYYDPTGPSDLEHMLRHGSYPAALLARAAVLRDRIVALSVTKYNVGREGAPPLVPPGRRGVLVVGQVEDDASITLGAAGSVRTNMALLRAARERNPEAFIIYKPHPDVAAGYRAGAIPEEAARQLADAVVTDRAITALYPECQALETITSLSGFEALMRGLHVTTHGQPFYAGWGLTEDLAPPVPRRGRPLTIEALCAAALILYPRYLDPQTRMPCTPERAVEWLAAERARPLTRLEQARNQARHAFAYWSRRVVRPLRQMRERWLSSRRRTG